MIIHEKKLMKSMQVICNLMIYFKGYESNIHKYITFQFDYHPIWTLAVFPADDHYSSSSSHELLVLKALWIDWILKNLNISNS